MESVREVCRDDDATRNAISESTASARWRSFTVA